MAGREHGTEEGGCLVAMGGGAPALAEMLALFECPAVREDVPWLRLAGVVSGEGVPDIRARLALMGASLYAGVAELVSAQPELSLVFDLHDDFASSLSLRAGLPDGVSVVDRRVAEVFRDMLSPDGGRVPCRTNLLRARAFLTTVLDGMKEDILLLDTSGRVVDCNHNLSERLGRSRGEIVGLHCRDLEAGDFCRRSKRECPFEETLVTGAKAEAVHTRLNEEGRLQYYRVYTYPLFGEDGKLVNVVEMRRDITSRTYTEQRLQQARKMAAIGELSTYIAHEIRNPLFAIGGFARSLLRNGELNAESRDKVGIILEEARRLDGILKSILNFARPTDVGTRDVDVNHVAGETVQLMSIGCDHEGICLKTELSQGIAQAQGEPELLKQCLINMVKNSMEAIEGEDGCITLSTGMDGKFVFVRVEDNGKGIPNDVKLRVFNPFFSTKAEGSGLGLAMTKKIVEDVGGRIQLNSHEGVGTAVTIFLPLALAVDEDTLDAGDVPA